MAYAVMHSVYSSTVEFITFSARPPAYICLFVVEFVVYTQILCMLTSSYTFGSCSTQYILATWEHFILLYYTIVFLSDQLALFPFSLCCPYFRFWEYGKIINIRLLISANL